MHVMFLNFQWLQMSLRSLCLLYVRILVLQILPCIPRHCCLLHAGSCRSIWKTLRCSLQVSIPHPRNHSSSWLLLHSWKVIYQWCRSTVSHNCWKVMHQWCRSTVSHNCIVSQTSWILWKYHHILLYLGLFLEPSSLVLRNKSHPSFLIGYCTRSFLQVKCISCMVRNIS